MPTNVSRIKPKTRPSRLERRLAAVLAEEPSPLKLRTVVRDLHRALVRYAIERYRVRDGWNVAAAARDLGITRATLYRLVKYV